jgi:hypothetical protein
LEVSKKAITHLGWTVERAVGAGLRATGQAIHRAGEKIDAKA